MDFADFFENSDNKIDYFSSLVKKPFTDPDSAASKELDVVLNLVGQAKRVKKLRPLVFLGQAGRGLYDEYTKDTLEFEDFPKIITRSFLNSRGKTIKKDWKSALNKEGLKENAVYVGEDDFIDKLLFKNY